MYSVSFHVDGVEEKFYGETLEEARNKRADREIELHKQFREKHAKDKKSPVQHLQQGHLLWMPDGKYVFRIYEPIHGTYKDYALAAQDIHIQILDPRLSLYENEEHGNRIDW